MTHTKIVCTIGPSTCDTTSIHKLMKCGMNLARLNGSHNTLEWHRETIERIRTLNEATPILLDIPGRKLRVDARQIPVDCSVGTEVVFSHDAEGDGSTRIIVDSSHISDLLNKGDPILVADGKLEFAVKYIQGKDVVTEVVSAGRVGSRMGINLPNSSANLPVFSQGDRELIQFGIENGIDFLGFSFVGSAAEVKQLRQLIGAVQTIGVISKIETQSGIENLDEILEVSDGILLDRGDLGSETTIENVGVLQKRVIAEANAAAKPVIVATQMLHSMVNSQVPTKAEITDITNAVIDGASALMLSEETAIGAFPNECVSLMKRVITQVEETGLVQSQAGSEVLDPSVEDAQPRAIAKAIDTICKSMHVTKIVCVTMSGFAARVVSSHKPDQKILAATNSVERTRQFNLLWGVEGSYVPFEFDPYSSSHIVQCLKALWQQDKIVESDTIVVTAVMHPRRGNRMNMIEIHNVSDLATSFGWKTAELDSETE